MWIGLDFLVNGRLNGPPGFRAVGQSLWAFLLLLLLCSIGVEASPVFSILSSSLQQASVVCCERNHGSQTGGQDMPGDPEQAKVSLCKVQIKPALLSIPPSTQSTAVVWGLDGIMDTKSIL